MEVQVESRLPDATCAVKILQTGECRILVGGNVSLVTAGLSGSKKSSERRRTCHVPSYSSALPPRLISISERSFLLVSSAVAVTFEAVENLNILDR